MVGRSNAAILFRVESTFSNLSKFNQQASQLSLRLTQKTPILSTDAPIFGFCRNCKTLAVIDHEDAGSEASRHDYGSSADFLICWIEQQSLDSLKAGDHPLWCLNVLDKLNGTAKVLHLRCQMATEQFRAVHGLSPFQKFSPQVSAVEKNDSEARCSCCRPATQRTDPVSNAVFLTDNAPRELFQNGCRDEVGEEPAKDWSNDHVDPKIEFLLPHCLASSMKIDVLARGSAGLPPQNIRLLRRRYECGSRSRNSLGLGQVLEGCQNGAAGGKMPAARFDRPPVEKQFGSLDRVVDVDRSARIDGYWHRFAPPTSIHTRTPNNANARVERGAGRVVA
jgi:hypothetical protein